VAELDVDKLMMAIREAALKRPPRVTTTFATSAPPPTGSSQRLNLSPEFTTENATTYHVNDLLKYQNRDFVRNAYRAILKREPDSAGFRHNLQLLQSGVFNKIDILASLRYSEEGKCTGVTINGLRFPATVRSLERIPVIGYLLQLLIGLVRLPAMIRSQREFQGYIMAQQSLIADYFNDAQRVVSNDLQRHNAALEILPRELTSLREQLRALETTLNETVLMRINEEQQKLQQAEAKLLLLTNRLAEVAESLAEHRQEFASLSFEVKAISRNLADESNRTVEELREWDTFYAAFEQQFRGSSDEVEQRLRFYLQYLKAFDSDSKILDIGSGRGDWLELLTKEGFHPHGVEVNDVLAGRSREKGLDVAHDEMMVYLGRQPDNSLDVISVFHLIEHFNVDRLIRLLDEIRRTLKPGGLLMLETPSPENLVVGACNFYADPTHYKPIYPQTLLFLLSNTGFVVTDLQFLHPVDGSPFTGDSEGSEQLNNWFFGPRDFSVIARKAQ
jgi:SAM-dependent methyltransferase